MKSKILDARQCRREKWQALSWGWVIYGLIYFSFGFQPGILRSDDFGYLRSILGTLEKGQPYTYEWLAPLGIVFSSACALLFRISGNFYVSVYGFQAFCVLAFFPLLYLLLIRRFSLQSASILTLALATFPIFLAKEADFHGGICTIDLFLLSLICFESGKYGWFFFPAFLAFANRQNQICLLLLPLWLAVVEYRCNKRISWKLVVGTITCILMILFTLAYMNRTYAVLHGTFQHSGWLDAIGRGTLAFLAGSLITMCLTAYFSKLENSASVAGPSRGKRWLWPICATLVLLAILPFWHDELIKLDTPAFGLFGWPEVNHFLPWLILPGLWLLDFRLFKPSPYLILIAGYIVIASLRGVWWDYYFMEIIILGLLLNFPSVSFSLSTVDSLSSHPIQHLDADYALPSIPLRGLIFLIAFLFGNLGYAYFLKVSLDKQMLSVQIMERLERKGVLTVDKMTGAPFGFLGWKLFDYFLANEGKTFGALADFLGYVRRDRVVVDSYLPWRHSFKSPLQTSAVILDTGTYCIGYLSLPYRVVNLHGPDTLLSISGRPMTLDSTQFVSPRYPLNNAEWKDFLSQFRK